MTMDPSRPAGTRVIAWLGALDRLQRFILLKLITGEFRVGVSQTLVVRALAQAAGLPAHDDRRPADGRLDADGRVVRVAPLARAATTTTDRGRIRSISRRRSRAIRQRSAIRGLARRVEVGRHPRAARSPRGDGPPLVARRGAHHAPLSGDRRGRHASARRHRARRRGARLSRRSRRCPSPRCSSASAVRSWSRRWSAPVPVVFMTYDILEDEGDGRAREAACGAPRRGCVELARRSMASCRLSPLVQATTLGGAGARCAPTRGRAASRA